MTTSPSVVCPCGSGLPYAGCCGRFIDGEQPAPTAERLMRSRYTAFVIGRESYLLETWHPSTRPPALRLDGTPPPKWLGLKILSVEAGNEGDLEGRVEFVARFRQGGGPATRLHENSRFLFDQGRWYYVDGTVDSGRG